MTERLIASPARTVPGAAAFHPRGVLFLLRYKAIALHNRLEQLLRDLRRDVASEGGADEITLAEALEHLVEGARQASQLVARAHVDGVVRASTACKMMPRFLRGRAFAMRPRGNCE